MLFFGLYFQRLSLMCSLQRWCSGAAGCPSWASSSTHDHFPGRLLPVSSTKVKGSLLALLPLLVLHNLGVCYVLTIVQFFSSVSTCSSDSYSVWSLTARTGPSAPQQAPAGAVSLYMHTSYIVQCYSHSFMYFPCRNLQTMWTWSWYPEMYTKDSKANDLLCVIVCVDDSYDLRRSFKFSVSWFIKTRNA